MKRKVATYTGSLVTVAFVSVALLNFSEVSPHAGEMIPPAVLSAPHETMTTVETAVAKVVAPSTHYIEITDGCGPYYTVGTCVNMHLGPGVEFPVIARLRTGIVLRVEKETIIDATGQAWYKIIFDQAIRYPERTGGEWYVAVDPSSVRSFEGFGDERIEEGVTASTTKRIVVSLSEKMLYAYEGDTLFMKEPVSPGLEVTPTPRGTFSVYYKTPSRYMQGPLPGISDQAYDLPGVPWNLYFTPEGAVVHGAYWHDHFGERWSHGCVNLPPQAAEKLYHWADLGTAVIVHD